MAVTPNSALYPAIPRSFGTGMTTALGAGGSTVIVAGAAQGTKVNALWVTNGDPAVAHVFEIDQSVAGNIVSAARITLPQSNVAVNMLSTSVWPGLPFDADGNPYIFLGSTSDTLGALYGTTLNVGTQIVTGGHAADMSTTVNQIITPQTPRLFGIAASTANTSAGSPFFLIIGGANGTKLIGLWGTSGDTVDRSVTMTITTTVFKFFTNFTLPAGAGTVAGVPPFNMFSPSIWPLPLDSDGNPYLLFGSTVDTITLNYNGLTATKQFLFGGVAADF